MRIVGLDPNSTQGELDALATFVEAANRKFPNKPKSPPARLLPRSLQNIASNPQLASTQDVVNVNSAFRFMSQEDRAAFFKNAAKMLKPGGLLLMGNSPQIVTRSGVSSVMRADDPTQGNNALPLIDYDEEVFAAANEAGLLLFRLTVGTRKGESETYYVADDVTSLYEPMDLMVQRGARYFLFGFIKRQESDAEDQVTGDTEGA